MGVIVGCFPQEPRPGQVFKDRDYLADNLYMSMLSELKAVGQQEMKMGCARSSKLGIWLWSSAFGVYPVARLRDVS
jgi:hypothetical protein